MSHTVGVLAPNGTVGASVVKYLIPHHKQGSIKLILLHRPGGPPRNVPDGLGIESREIDLEGGDASSLEKTIQGINVFVSVIAPQALGLEVKLAEALATSKDLVYFVPSLFGRPWRAEETSEPAKQGLAGFIFAGRNRASELGVKVTIVECGYFDYSMFRDKMLGADIKKNEFHLSSKQIQHHLPITSTDYLGAAIASLATQPPADVAGKTFSAVQFKPTGQEVVGIMTNIHKGQQTKIVDFTEADLKDLVNDTQGFGVAVAGYRENWERDQWEYGPAIKVEGRPAEELEEIVQRYK